jgi:hypothetical protein
MLHKKKQNTMKTKYISTILITAFLFVACGKENKLGEPTVLPPDVNIPQGTAPPEVDQRIVDFFHKYNTYLIYDFTPDEVAWRLVGAPASLTAYSMPKTNPSRVGDQIDLLHELFFDFFPDEFLRKYLPYKIFLADQVLFRTVATNPWNEWAAWTTGLNMIFGYGRLDYRLSADTMYMAFNSVHMNFLNFLTNNSKLTFPEEFFLHSNYTVGITAATTPYVHPTESRFRSIQAPADAHLAAGFFANISTLQSIANLQRNDVVNYLTYMRHFTKDSPQWQRFLSFPRVKAKYDILVDYWIRTYGYNPHDLANVDFGEIVL